MMLRTLTSRVVLISGAIIFSQAANAEVVIQPGGGCANCGFSNIGNSDPKYDTIRFPPPFPPSIENNVVIYLSEDLSFTDPVGNYFNSIWENIEFDGQVRNNERTKASLIGVNWVTKSLSGGFVRNLSTSNLTLTDTDLNTGQIRLEFLGSDNTLTLQNSSITIAGDSPGISSLAPMTIDITGGSNSISNLTKNYNPTSLTLNIASGASLEFLDSGVPLTTVTANRLYFRTPVTGLVDGGTLTFNLSNVYFNTTSDFKFSNNAQFSLAGFGTSAEFENLQFANSNIDLDRNTALRINNQLKITDTDVSIDYGANFTAELVKPYGTINFSSPGTGSRLNVESLSFGDGGAGQLDIRGVSQTNIGYLYFVNGAGSSLSVDSELNISDGLYAIGNPQITLLNGANFNLLGASNPISSQLDLNINTGATFSVGRSGQFAHISSANILNNGEIKIDGDYLVVGNTTMSGTGAVNVLDNGRILLRSPQSTLTLDNPLTFGSIVYPLSGGELHSVLDVASSNPEIGSILYGAGDIDLTRARSLTVSQQGSATASELDGKYFTVVSAQNNAVAGTLLGASSLNIIEDGNIPALTDFQIVDLNTNGHPDLTLQAVFQQPSVLVTHPSLVSTTTQVTNANSTNLVSAIVTNPTSNLSSGISVSTALNGLTNSHVAQLTEVHAEPYASFMTVALQSKKLLSNMVIGRSLAATGPRNPQCSSRSTKEQTALCDRRGWFDISYIDGKIDADAHLGDFSYSVGQLVGGVDLVDEPMSSLGLYFGISNSRMHEHDAIDQKFSSEEFSFGLYGDRWLTGGLQLAAMGGVTIGSSNSERLLPATIGSFAGGTARAEFDTRSAYAGLRLQSNAFSLKPDGWNLKPSVGVTYIHASTSEAHETGGGDFNLSIARNNAKSLVIAPGVDIGKKFKLNNGVPISIGGQLNYEYDVFADRKQEHQVRATSQIFGSFTQFGQNQGAHSMRAGLDVMAELSPNAQIGLRYDFTKHTHGSANELAIGFAMKW